MRGCFVVVGLLVLMELGIGDLVGVFLVDMRYWDNKLRFGEVECVF